MRDINLGVIHCSATKPNFDIGAAEIDTWHRSPPRKWSKIGYHGVIRRNGVWENGRPLNEIGAHAYGFNLNSIGICLIGGLDYDGKPAPIYSENQMYTLAQMMMAFDKLFPGIRWVGHRDLSPDVDGDGVIEKWEWTKDCPCFDVQQYIDEGYVLSNRW
ncbi:MAG: hypothetical protein DWQ49_09790 [Bacteroidetes bacterium]|nr:MAG: hypothetical protein DWQ49_09790 [Bacteroidota bacterium]